MTPFILLPFFALVANGAVPGSASSDRQPHRCRPWLFSTQVKLRLDRWLPDVKKPVQFNVTYQQGCTSENQPYLLFTWVPQVAGQAIGLEISSLEVAPAQRTVLENAILDRMDHGLSRADIAFYRDNVVPMLQAGDESGAKRIWGEWLISGKQE